MRRLKYGIWHRFIKSCYTFVLQRPDHELSQMSFCNTNFAIPISSLIYCKRVKKRSFSTCRQNGNGFVDFTKAFRINHKRKP